MKKIDKVTMKVTGLALLTALFVSISTLPVHAQSTIDLTVSPPSQDIALTPGEEKTVQIKFYNRTDENLTGMFKKADFLVLDKEGSPTLFDTSTANNRFAASSWMTLSQDRVTIPAKTQVIVSAQIKVPADAYPCARYTSVYFEPTPPQLGGKPVRVETQTSVAFKLASLMYMNVAGQCKESAFISKFTLPSFMEYGPIPVSFEVLNRSDYHVTPQIVGTLSNMSGKEIDAKPFPQNNIFPDAVRVYSTSLGQRWMFGQYKIEVAGGYGKTGKALTSYATVIVFPWRLALVIILAIVILGILIKTITGKTDMKTSQLEKEIELEKEEIEKLKKQLKGRPD